MKKASKAEARFRRFSLNLNFSLSLSLFLSLSLSHSSRRSVSRKCGIIGIHKASGPASVELYEGLLMLQHRGQDSAGMVTVRREGFIFFSSRAGKKKIPEKEKKSPLTFFFPLKNNN